MNRLTGRVAIVTGASSGIGKATALCFAREGAHVVFTGRTQETGDEVAEHIRREVPTATGLFIQADSSIKADIISLVKETGSRFGRIDILVNTAQTTPPYMPLEQTTDDIFQMAVNSGLYGTFWAMQQVFPYMRSQGSGRIVNFTSTAPFVGLPGAVSYASTKGAIIALTRTAANEWGQFGITVNVISPVATSASSMDWAKAHPDEMRDLARNIPLRGGGPPENVAAVVLGLVTEDASFITGETIGADGGSAFLIRQRNV